MPNYANFNKCLIQLVYWYKTKEEEIFLLSYSETINTELSRNETVGTLYGISEQPRFSDYCVVKVCLQR